MVIFKYLGSEIYANFQIKYYQLAQISNNLKQNIYKQNTYKTKYELLHRNLTKF